jgi:hypothetical protein
MRNLQTAQAGTYTGELQSRLFKKLLNQEQFYKNKDGFKNMKFVEQTLPIQNGSLIEIKEYEIRNTHGCRTRFTGRVLECFYYDGKIIAN